MIPKIKRLVLDPDPRLRAPNVDVTEPWEELEPATRKMFKIMYSTGVGVGLAAPQVGWNVKLFIINPDQKNKKPKNQRVFWNPEPLVLLGEAMKMEEGCLSLPKVFGHIMRYPAVILKAMTPDGPIEEKFEGFKAQIMQHEVGHLLGDLCFDRYIK